MTTPNSGPVWRRWAQALGLIYNDDGTWGWLHVRVPRSSDGSMPKGFREPPGAP